MAMKTIRIDEEAYRLLESAARKRDRKGNSDMGDLASKAIRMYVEGTAESRLDEIAQRLDRLEETLKSQKT